MQEPTAVLIIAVATLGVCLIVLGIKIKVNIAFLERFLVRKSGEYEAMENSQARVHRLVNAVIISGIIMLLPFILKASTILDLLALR